MQRPEFMATGFPSPSSKPPFCHIQAYRLLSMLQNLVLNGGLIEV
ncbi:hypothetical protein [Carboxylicivirga sediminis]|nr:hypothetical protein [Carboxylicivirga sediminis]